MTEYIIVVEVDYLRARAAYQKGMYGLLEEWPSLILEANMIDQLYNDRDMAEDAEYDNKVEKYHKDLEDYRKKLKIWEDQFFRNEKEKPERPHDPTAFSTNRIDRMYRTKNPSMISLNQVKENLQEKLDLSNAAQKNFNMTETSVKNMIKWENGEKIKELFQQLKDRKEWFYAHK